MYADRPYLNITFTTPGDAEASLAKWWPAIEACWPVFGGMPTPEPIDFDSACELACAALQPVIFAVFPADAKESDVYKIAGHIAEERVPAVFLFEGDVVDVADFGGPGILTIGQGADPSAIAATLNALAASYDSINEIKGELHNMSRLHGGASEEINKFHEELTLAAEVQGAFLPEAIPTADTLNISSIFKPASYVSGDIYDLQKIGEHHISFFLADAVGHGVPAALLTMVIARSMETTLRDLGEDTPSAPAEVLYRLNKELVSRCTASPRFASAVYGVIDTRDRCVTMAGAGHPPSFVIGPNGRRSIDSCGGLLGIFDEDAFDQVSFTLAPDEMLVIYSDGFELAFPEPGADTYARRKPTTQYLNHFDTMANAWREGDQLSKVVSSLAHTIDTSEGSLHQLDDLTALVITPSNTTSLDKLFDQQHAAENHQLHHNSLAAEHRKASQASDQQIRKSA